ncbi:MAG: hypothetical protein JSR72_17655 [Proteobacteria bacterium]|nr:hypothetical protein [Pseudomonadota bacterium]
MPKRYVILCDDDIVVFPIKAAINPYDGSPAFLAGEPNFFGGADARREDPLTTLQREVREESVGTYEIHGYDINAISQGSYRQNRRLVQCEFCISRNWTMTGPWPDEGTWLQGDDDEREMCFVAAMPLQNLDQFIGVPVTANALFPVLMEGARATAPQWARAQFRDVPSRAFAESLTGRAFAAFVTGWAAGQRDERAVRAAFLRRSGEIRTRRTGS